MREENFLSGSIGFLKKLVKYVPSWFPILFALLMLLILLSAVYLVDIIDIYGVPFDIRRHEGLYGWLFREAGPIEWLQWGMLGFIFINGIALCSIYWKKGKLEERNFWGLVAFSFILMLIEDAGNPRHFLAGYFEGVFNVPRAAIEGPFFFLIVLPLIIAFLRYKTVLFSHKQASIYVISGGTLYAIAGLASLFREVKWDFYQVWGTKLTDIVTGGVIPGYGLMDLIVTESMELMAASIILSGVIAYWKKNQILRLDGN